MKSVYNMGLSVLILGMKIQTIEKPRGFDKMNEFDEVQFHDAYITGFEANTVNDHFDVITVYLESDNFVSYYGKDKIKIVFKDCYQAIINIQMWITGKDTIREIRIENTSELLNRLISRQNKGLLVKAHEFKHFHIELNSSASIFEIISKGYDIIVVD